MFDDFDLLRVETRPEQGLFFGKKVPLSGLCSFLSRDVQKNNTEFRMS